MTFLSPWLGGVAAAIAVPSLIILYFLKLRRRDVEISTTLLWKKAIQDLQANAPFQKLRRNILLILQLIILASVLFALAQPQIKGQTLIGHKHVILIDRSASMSAMDAEGKGEERSSRLEQAKKEAIALIESLREGGVFGKRSGTESGDADEAMIIAFDSAAEVRQTFTSDKRALREAIESLKPTENPTSMEEAMRLARAHAPKRLVEGNAIEGLTGGPPLTIHVWSDGRIPDADKAKPAPQDTVLYHRVGTKDGPNIAIVGLRGERSFDNPARLSIFVGLQSNLPIERRVDVELVIDGVPQGGLKTVTIGPAQSGNPEPTADNPPPASTSSTPDSASYVRVIPGVGGTVFKLDRPEGALIQVNLRDPSSSEAPEGDTLAVDNRAWLVVPPAKKLAVLLVSKGNLFLSSVLGGLPLSKLHVSSPAEYEELLKANKTGEYDVTVLDGFLPTHGVGLTGLPPGRFVVFGAVPTGKASGLTDGGKGGQSIIIDWMRNHPALRSVSLDPLVIGESRIVEIAQGSGASVLAQSDKGPAIIEISSAETHAIVVPFDPANSNWPFDVGFVVFTAAAVNFVGEEGGSGVSARSIQPGQILSDRLPVGVGAAKVQLPGGDSQDLKPAPDGRIVFGPVDKAGMYRVSWTGQAGPTDAVEGNRVERYYAANLLDSAESDIGTTGELAIANKIAQATTNTSAKADKRLWPYLLLAALGIIMLEWFVYNRKVQV